MHEDNYRKALDAYHADYAAAAPIAKAAYDSIIEPARAQYTELVDAARKKRDESPKGDPTAGAVFVQVVEHGDEILRAAHNRAMQAHTEARRAITEKHQGPLEAARVAFRESLDPPAKQA